jgi:hypothetical protein
MDEAGSVKLKVSCAVHTCNHTDHLTMHIEQRPTGIAMVDAGFCLKNMFSPGCRPSRFPFEEPGGKTRLEADEVKRKGERMNNTAKTPESTDKWVGFGRDSEKVKAPRSAFQKNFSPLWPPQAVF